MTILLVLLAAIFLVVACVAVGFAVWPVLRARDKTVKARATMAAALGFAIIGIGGGSYVMLGQPQLALRTLQGDNATDPNALIARLARHMVQSPGDARGWTLLGRAYLSMGDPEQATKAFAQGLSVEKNPNSQLLSSYGEALVISADGAVTTQAEKAFQQAVAQDPQNNAAQYYLGLAAKQNGNAQKAETTWQGVVDSMKSDDPFRSYVLDQLAQLKAQSGGNVDISAMVEGLAARLKVEPHDGEGWRRLVRAYSVLGDADKAKAALADGRAALAADPAARDALEAEARDLKLN